MSDPFGPARAKTQAHVMSDPSGPERAKTEGPRHERTLRFAEGEP